MLLVLCVMYIILVQYIVHCTYYTIHKLMPHGTPKRAKVCLSLKDSYASEGHHLVQTLYYICYTLYHSIQCKHFILCSIHYIVHRSVKSRLKCTKSLEVYEVTVSEYSKQCV